MLTAIVEASADTRRISMQPCRAASFSQHQARNWVVTALTGRPSTKRSQTSPVVGRNTPWPASALGSGSSLATACSTSCRGRPVPAQACRPLRLVARRDPLTRVPRRSRWLFSSVRRVGAADPGLGALPAHAQPCQRRPHGLAADLLRRHPLGETHFGRQGQRPEAGVLPERARRAVQQFAQARRPGRVEGGVRRRRAGGATRQRGRGVPVERPDRVAHRLVAAAQAARDGRCVRAPRWPARSGRAAG